MISPSSSFYMHHSKTLFYLAVFTYVLMKMLNLKGYFICCNNLSFTWKVWSHSMSRGGGFSLDGILGRWPPAYDGMIVVFFKFPNVLWLQIKISFRRFSNMAHCVKEEQFWCRLSDITDVNLIAIFRLLSFTTCQSHLHDKAFWTVGSTLPLYNHSFSFSSMEILNMQVI